MDPEKELAALQDAPRDLPQSYKDQVLRLVRDAVGNYVDEKIEKRLEKGGERSAAVDERVSQLRRAITAGEQIAELGKGQSLIGTAFHCIAKAKNDLGRAQEMIDKALGSPVGAKTLNLQSVDEGGALVQGDVLNLFFDVLRPRVAVLSLGPTEVPMPSRSLQITGFTGDATTYFVGEPNTSEISSQPTTGARNFSAKKQMTLVPISSQMLAAPPGPQIARFVEQGLVRRMAIAKDEKLIRGAGTQFTPKGMRFWASNTTAMTATPTLSTALTDVRNALQKLAEDNVPMEKLGWIMAPRSKHWLMFSAIDADNKPYFLEEMRGGTFMSYPFRDTNNVPTNLGGGGDESEVFLADFPFLLYASVGAMEVRYFDQGSYTEGGTLVSAMERDESVLRVKDEWDFNVEYEAAIHVTTGVTWGV